MPLFDGIFKPKLTPEQTAAARAQLKTELVKGIIDADAERRIAYNDIMRAIERARNAIANNDEIGKATAMNELRLHLGMYRYMSAMYGNLKLMESNFAAQDITQNFADFVHRVSSIKVPASTVNFDKLTAQALRGIKPVNLSGVEKMAQNLIDGSMKATNTAFISDKYLEDLVNGTVSLGDPAQTAAPNGVDIVDPTVQSNPEVADDATDELRKMLQEINAGLNK